MSIVVILDIGWQLCREKSGHNYMNGIDRVESGTETEHLSVHVVVTRLNSQTFFYYN